MGKLIAIGALGLVGCASAPQQPIPLSATSFGASQERIGVAMVSLPTVDTYFPGANCLLCMAVASVANTSLTAHTKTLPQDDLLSLKAQLAEALRKKGATVVVIDEPFKLDALPDAAVKGPNLAKKDFSALKAKYQLSKLLLVDLTLLGVERTYSGYVPTSDPKGVVRGAGYLVDLSSNAYAWYVPLNVLKASDGSWDEPPKFPGVTNAYFQAIEVSKDSLVKPFLE